MRPTRHFSRSAGNGDILQHLDSPWPMRKRRAYATTLVFRLDAVERRRPRLLCEHAPIWGDLRAAREPVYNFCFRRTGDWAERTLTARVHAPALDRAAVWPSQ